jgi:hypothetical protein
MITVSIKARDVLLTVASEVTNKSSVDFHIEFFFASNATLLFLVSLIFLPAGS